MAERSSTPWYRLMLPPGDAVELRLYDLCTSIRRWREEQEGASRRDVSVVARSTDHGGIEVRMTWDAVGAASDAMPHHVIEEVGSPDMANGWTRYVGSEDDSEK